MITPRQLIALMFGFVPGLLMAAVPESEWFVPEVDVRESAKRILSDPDFQSFDHFGEAHVGPASEAVPEGSTFRDAAPPASSGTGAPSSRQSRGSGKTDSGTGSGKGNGSNSGSSTDSSQKSSSGSGEASESRPTTSKSNNEASTGEASSTKETATTPAGDTARPERYASKTTDSGTPSLRGHDGVERPVRFAPKPKTPPKPPQWDWQWDWSFDLGLGEFFSGLGTLLSGSIQILAYTALAIVCGLILFLASRAIAEMLKSRRGQTRLSTTTVVPLADDHSPGELSADIYLQRALEFAEQGHYREALGQLILGAMSVIERQQWIRYRRGLTLHDYLRSVRSRPDQYQGLQLVAAAYEPVEYGRRIASAEHFHTALEGYRSGFEQMARP